MNNTQPDHGHAVRDSNGDLVAVLVGRDAAEAATWWAEAGFEVTEVSLGASLVAA